ncbi:RTF2 [Sanghuangporus weigelae]
MGNDGGSIPDRRDLVRTKVKAEQADKANQTRARWFYCALSKRPLEEPIVSCALGKLYNKDALLEYLLDKSAYGDGDEICGHIKSLKDVKTLKLTLNPSSSDPNSSSDRAKFICPLNLREMNGGVPFVYIATCGCVFSQSGLKALGRSTGSPSSDEDRGNEKADEKDTQSKQLELCPQCGTKYDRIMDVRMINPDPETEQVMRAAMELRRREKSEKGKSKSKKRKAEDAGATAESSVETKKSKAVPTVNPSIAAASRAVANSLAEEEAKRKAQMSDAVRSLYESKSKGSIKGDASWMTRTFNRTPKPVLSSGQHLSPSSSLSTMVSPTPASVSVSRTKLVLRSIFHYLRLLRTALDLSGGPIVQILKSLFPKLLSNPHVREILQFIFLGSVVDLEYTRIWGGSSGYNDDNMYMLTLSVWSRNRKILDEFVQEARTHYLNSPLPPRELMTVPDPVGIVSACMRDSSYEWMMTFLRAQETTEDTTDLQVTTKQIDLYNPANRPSERPLVGFKAAPRVRHRLNFAGHWVQFDTDANTVPSRHMAYDGGYGGGAITVT